MFGEPTKEHAWLQQLVGDWTYEGECYGGPDQPPMKSSGSETIRPLGGFWVMAEGKGQMPGGGDAAMIMTLGYDVGKNRYQGTWVGSMMPHLWVYDGRMDADKRILTLAADGPSMAGDGTMQNYEDIIELVDPNHRILRARALGSDGKWNQFMETHYRRKV